MSAPTTVEQETRKVVKRALPLTVVLLTVLSLLIFVYLALQLTVTPTRGVVADDQTISDYLMRHPEGALTNIWLAITLLGSGWPLVLVVLACSIFLIRTHHVQMAIALIVTAGTGGLLNQILKDIFHRTRPLWDPALVHPGGYSFPSGHSMAAMVVYGFIIYALLSTGTRTRARTAAAIGLAVLIALVAASRVFLGAHWLTDVLGGAAAGLVWLVICIAVAEWAGARDWYPSWLRPRRNRDGT